MSVPQTQDIGSGTYARCTDGGANDGKLVELTCNSDGSLKQATGTAGSPTATTLPAATPAPSSALAGYQILKNSAGKFYSVAADIDGSLATGAYYVLIIDAASLPADGAVTLLAAIPVDHTNGTRDQFTAEADQGGYAFTSGCIVALSTTRPSLTHVSGGYLWCNGSVG